MENPKKDIYQVYHMIPAVKSQYNKMEISFSRVEDKKVCEEKIVCTIKDGEMVCSLGDGENAQNIVGNYKWSKKGLWDRECHYEINVNPIGILNFSVFYEKRLISTVEMRMFENYHSYDVRDITCSGRPLEDYLDILRTASNLFHYARECYYKNGKEILRSSRAYHTRGLTADNPHYGECIDGLWDDNVDFFKTYIKTPINRE